MKLVGVTTIFCAAHRNSMWDMHGHTYEVTAWFRASRDMTELLSELSMVTKNLDHVELPHLLTLAEDIAEHVGNKLRNLSCVEVIVSRPLERIHAKWVA